MWHISDGMGWWMLAGMLVELLIVIGVVVAAAVCLGRPRLDRRPEDPLEIAGRRYASGEITRDEYEQVRRDLSDASGARTGST